ncbi:MAG: DUF5670 family protein [Gemmatimonadaceae bacterium]
MTLGIAVALIVLWFVIRVFFKVTKWVIHLVLLVAVCALAFHYIRA